MNTKRLLRLAEYLETVPPEEFDIDHWSCGATACAIGHACTIPAFKRAGLSMEELVLAGAFTFLAPVFRGKTDWRAVEAFFRLTEDQATHLFFGDSLVKEQAC